MLSVRKFPRFLAYAVEKRSRTRREFGRTYCIRVLGRLGVLGIGQGARVSPGARGTREDMVCDTAENPRKPLGTGGAAREYHGDRK